MRSLGLAQAIKIWSTIGLLAPRSTHRGLMTKKSTRRPSANPANAANQTPAPSTALANVANPANPKRTYISLTRDAIEKIDTPGFHWFGDPKGFGLKVLSTRSEATGRLDRVYIAEGKIKGEKNKSCRVTIGRHGVFTPNQARDEAKKYLALMAQGINPNDEARKNRAVTASEKQRASLTLQQVLDDYCRTRQLKESTEHDYRKIVKRCFGEWLNRPIVAITKDMVERRHQQLSNLENPKKPGWSGKAQANLAMRVLRAVFTYAGHTYEDASGKALVTDNPVKRLSQVRAWNRVARRQSVIKQHELMPWYQSVVNLKNDSVRDYLLLCLFTGLRRNEAAGLRWEDVDLTGKTLTVRDTKNHSDHILPLSDFIYDMLRKRWSARKNEYVFPGGMPGATFDGHLVDPKKAIAQVTKDTSIRFMVHDLRRTFLTIAESLDIPHYALKKLANHRSGADVTQGYIVVDVERLRGPMQKITDAIKLLSAIDQSEQSDAASAEEHHESAIVLPFKKAR